MIMDNFKHPSKLNIGFGKRLKNAVALLQMLFSSSDVFKILCKLIQHMLMTNKLKL